MSAPAKGKHAYNLATSFLWATPDLLFFLKSKDNQAKTYSKCHNSEQQILQEQIQNNWFDLWKNSAPCQAELCCEFIQYQ